MDETLNLHRNVSIHRYNVYLDPGELSLEANLWTDESYLFVTVTYQCTRRPQSKINVKSGAKDGGDSQGVPGQDNGGTSLRTIEVKTLTLTHHPSSEEPYQGEADPEGVRQKVLG